MDPGLPGFAVAMPFELQGFVALAETTTVLPTFCPPFEKSGLLFSMGARYSKQVILPPSYKEADRGEVLAALDEKQRIAVDA